MARFASYLRLAATLLALMAGAAQAGPPFLTDDPEPTETGHWEIYGPYMDGEGRGADFEGSTGVEINYGAAANLQLTLGLPLAYAHAPAHWQAGAGDLEFSAKYRFYHDPEKGVQIAFFPGVTLPTARHDLGAGRATGFLPLWFQKDNGAWTAFGGGGYTLNPGLGNKNFWRGALAVTRQISPPLLLGWEATREGASTVDGRASTRLGMGAIYQLAAPFRLLGRAGPIFEDGTKKAGFHFFLALGLDY